MNFDKVIESENCINIKILETDFADLPKLLPFKALTGKNEKLRTKIAVPQTTEARQYSTYLNSKWAQYLRCVGGLANGEEKPLSLQKFARFYLSCDGRSGQKTFYISRNEASAAKDWLRQERGDHEISDKIARVTLALASHLSERKSLECILKQFKRHIFSFMTECGNISSLKEKKEEDEWATTIESKKFLACFHIFKTADWDESDLIRIERWLKKFRPPPSLSLQARNEINLIRKRLISKRKGISLLRIRWNLFKDDRALRGKS
jgi:hypothetical protein